MFPLGTDRPQRRIPWVNITLIAINVIIYFLSHSTAPRNQVPGIGFSAFWARYLLYPVPTNLYDFIPQLYQFITYQFMHQDLSHLFFNMLFLYVFGNNLNEKLGNIGYLLFYLTGGILAGCGQVLVSESPTLGASGSISAVAGLFFVLLPRTNIRVFIMIFIYIDVIFIPSVWFILFNVARDIVEPFIQSSSVAHSAHLAGYLSGFIIGIILLATRLVPRDNYDLMAIFDRWRRRRQYENLVAQGYDPFSTTPLPLRATPPQSPVTPPPVQDPRIDSLRNDIHQLLYAHQIPAAVNAYLELRQIDPQHVLPSQEQLDIANQLMADGRYDLAAAAYEDYLRLFGQAAQNEQIRLILGLIYARYLPQPERAVEMLRTALPKLHDPSQRQLAQAELARLSPPSASP